VRRKEREEGISLAKIAKTGIQNFDFRVENSELGLWFFLAVLAILARDILISLLRRDLGRKLPLLLSSPKDTECSFQRRVRRWRVRRHVQTEEITLAKIAKTPRRQGRKESHREESQRVFLVCLAIEDLGEISSGHVSSMRHAAW
jgi:hypothetical protein